MRFVLYSDFNCPFCYALHERLHEMGLMEQIDWRGVQHAPYLPIPMSAWQGTQKAELQHEVAIVQRLALNLMITLPSGKPNTRLAIERTAALLSHDRQVGMDFVRQAYRLFWRESCDLSDPSVLNSLAAQLEDSSGDTDESHGKSWQLMRNWEEAWHATEQAEVPLLVSPDGEYLVGCVPEESIRRFFN